MRYLTLVLLAITVLAAQSPAAPTPMVLQENQGDRWLLLGHRPLIFKIDPVTAGSNSLVIGTEVMPPGNKIPTHKHLYEDEAIFVRQTRHRLVQTGRRSRDVEIRSAKNAPETLSKQRARAHDRRHKR